MQTDRGRKSGHQAFRGCCDYCNLQVLRSKRHKRNSGIFETSDADGNAGENCSQICRFVDTHLHLEELLKFISQHLEVPSLTKGASEMSAHELRQWALLGWQDAVNLEARLSEERAGKGGPSWDLGWIHLSETKRRAAQALGWTSETWDRNSWPLPRGLPWTRLPQDTRENLAVLGESAASWDDFAGVSASTPASETDYDDGLVVKGEWSELTPEKQRAAAALGFCESNWNLERRADVHAALATEFFGARMDACITQGCDPYSIDPARELALAHPKVYASFGCHPKGAVDYSAKFEQMLLEASTACGNKTVAWGEVGLDYASPHYGKIASNRRQQRQVFARQLQIAIERKLPIVIHSRCAERDTLRLLRRWVPKKWRFHLHCQRGYSAFIETVFEEYPNAFVGVCGQIFYQSDVEQQEFYSRVPLERVLLETDAPYMPKGSFQFSYPQLVLGIASKLADLNPNVTVEEVLLTVRGNTRRMYGI